MNTSSNLPHNFDLSDITTYQAGVAQAAMHRLLQKECDEYLHQFGISKMHWLIIGMVLDEGKNGGERRDVKTEEGRKGVQEGSRSRVQGTK